MQEVKTKNFVLPLVNLLCILATSIGAKYKCSISGQLCTISALNLTKSDYKIEPEVANPADVTELKLEGNVPVLSNGICEALPNLKIFIANSLSVEEVDENAFQSCKKLTDVQLSYNKFINLRKNTFNGLNELQEILVLGGNLPVIDVDLTNLKQLKLLLFSSLNITVFPADILREQKKLEELYLYSNNLFDLDIERILNFTSNLKYIHFVDNNFKCTRLKEILALFHEKNIQAGKYYLSEHLRKRDYIPDSIDGIHCLSDHLWTTEFSKFKYFNSNDSFFENLKKKSFPHLHNAARIDNVEQEINNKLSSLDINHQNLQKIHDEKFITVHTKLDTLNESIDTFSEQQKRVNFNMQKTLNQTMKVFEQKLEESMTKVDVEVHNITRVVDKYFGNITQMMEKITELTNLGKQLQTQDLHRYVLYIIVVLNFLLILIVIAYLIRNRMTEIEYSPKVELLDL